MINFLKFLEAIFGVIRLLMDHLKERKLITTGKLEQAAEALVEQEKKVNNAEKLVDADASVDRSWLRRKTRNTDSN